MTITHLSPSELLRPSIKTDASATSSFFLKKFSSYATSALGALLLLTTLTHTALAGELDNYVGKQATALVGAIGEPALKLPQELWYSNANRVRGGRPRMPDSVVMNGQQGITVGGEYEPLRFSEIPCEITVHLTTEQVIQSIEEIGPGCFDMVHRLKALPR